MGNSEVEFLSAVYDSPIGELTLCSDGNALCGLWMQGQKYYGATIPGEMVPAAYGEDAVLSRAAKWLDAYFAGREPEISVLPLSPIGGQFRQLVWSALRDIPYGEVTTYGEIGRKVARSLGKERMASLAVGGAVGHNPISIIVPCHRVVGADGSLTGFSGGLDKKLWLLEHEGVDTAKLCRPKKGTAL